MSKGGKLDKFYTKPQIVKDLLQMIDLSKYDLVLEPSAGAGDFYNMLPIKTRLGIDLEPAHPDILKKDFFDYVSCDNKNTITIGNPPFGKNSKLAIKFFNHAAVFSDCIAFIVPRTFRKPSVINRLDFNFHLLKQKLLPLDSFYIPSGKTYKVPTVFQIWQKDYSKREKIQTLKQHPDFKFVPIDFNGKKPPSEAQKIKQCNNSDFCVQRVGVNAGKVYDNINKKYRDWKSHYYIKQTNPSVRSVMESIDWNFDESPKFDNAGNPSISKHDLINFYKKRIKNG